MEEVADVVFFDLQVAFIDIRHPRQGVHVRDDFAFGIMPDPPLAVAVAQAGNGLQRAPLGDFQTGVIEFLPPNPVNGRGRLEGFSRQDRRVRADEADFGFRPVPFDGFGNLAIVFQRRG